MPTLTQLEYLIAVDKLKHFGRAAQYCHVTQPSLSAQIQKLEEDLDVIIFDRSKRPIITTTKGKEILFLARKILHEHKQLIDVARKSSEPSGSFNLAVIPTLAPYLIPLFISSFSKQYPKVKLNISEYKTNDIIAGLVDDEIDGALLVTPLQDNRIIERPLFYEPFYLYVNSQHPFASRKYIPEEKINAEDVWLLEEGHCFRDQILKVCAMKQSAHPLENVTFESGSLETLINIIKNSKGFTLLPHLAMLTLSESEKNKNIKKFQENTPAREVSLVHSRSFLKEDIILALEKEIMLALPKGITTTRHKKISVIDI